MSEELLNTKEVARYLGIHEKQVYALIKARRIPATRLTGKWVFPKRLLDEWIEADARRSAGSTRAGGRRLEGALLASGSDDPVLSLLGARVRERRPELLVFSASTGSTAGLEALNRGLTDLAWSHLLDPASGTYNLPFLPARLPDLQPVVVNLFHRDLGLLVAPGNPLALRGWEDLGRERLRIVNRQAGSGTRLLLDHQLAKLGVDSGKLLGYEREVCTHHEVGVEVRTGEADAGLATGATARQFGLGFVPLVQEQFDMVLDQSVFFDEGVGELLEVLGSNDFRAQVTALGHYDLRECGKILSRGKPAASRACAQRQG